VANVVVGVDVGVVLDSDGDGDDTFDIDLGEQR
jgi:hypothetical protein